jgi:uncharacterized membrane protein YbhN (UPF0104 family)
MTGKFKIKFMQLVISVSTLAFVILSTDFSRIPTNISSIEIRYIFWAVLSALLQFHVGAWRWQQLIYLVTRKIVSLKLLTNIYIISFFASFILPGTITGDLYRVVDIQKVLENSVTATLTVVLERISGLGLLIFLGLGTWLVLPIHPKFRFGLSYWFTVAGLLIAIIVILLLVFLRNRSASVGRVIDWLMRFTAAARLLPSLARQNPLFMARFLFGTLLYQSLALFTVYFSLRAANVVIGIPVFILVASLVTLVIVLPISIQGIGVRESLYLALLRSYGAQPESILTGLTFTYLIGFPFIIWGWILFSRRGAQILNAETNK